MFRPEEQQVEICLLKSNLEEIENELVIQRSALPALDAENEQKYRETMTALRVTRSMNTEIERLKLENDVSMKICWKRLQIGSETLVDITYNEEEINKQTEKNNITIKQLTEELEKRQEMVDELKTQLNMIQPAVPEDILAVFGKQDLDNKIKELSDKLEALIEKRKPLLEN
ncbi:hypothetical protein HF086_013278 [Spodoptera exigua]|uniref:Uncharacterized protein n=1 Tax=Spodoptera exigua TaxID=7107 RepID=A0A922SAP3_SPOEX|nr:hypothetical protein HF086_013278 [Spodoptera exigua]